MTVTDINNIPTLKILQEDKSNRDDLSTRSNKSNKSVGNKQYMFYLTPSNKDKKQIEFKN